MIKNNKAINMMLPKSGFETPKHNNNKNGFNSNWYMIINVFIFFFTLISLISRRYIKGKIYKKIYYLFVWFFYLFNILKIKL